MTATAKPSNSWGHEIVLMRAEERGEIRDSDRGAPRYWCSNGRRCPGAHPITCWYDETYQTRYDPAPEGKRVYTYNRGGRTSYIVTYDYITGRSGRVSTNQRFYCVPCAEKFAKKHCLTLAARAPTRGKP